MTDPISPDLKTAMRRLRLGKLLDTLPERVALARQQKMAHQDFLFLLLSDECQRRDSAASTTAQRGASPRWLAAATTSWTAGNPRSSSSRVTRRP